MSPRDVTPDHEFTLFEKAWASVAMLAVAGGFVFAVTVLH